MTKNMTSGSPMKHILSFSGPLFLGMLFQQFYNLVDSVIVGQLLGPDALAAVGSTGSLNFLVLGFCMGVCNGFAIPVAQCFGARDEEGLRRYTANSFWLTIGFSVLMAAVTALACRRLLIWTNTPAGILQDAWNYLFIVFLGIPATCLYNLLASLLRSLGDSRTPVVFLTLSSLLNVALDITFIWLFHTGVMGAGIATVLAQSVSVLLCLVFIYRRYPVLKPRQGEWAFRRRLALKLCGMGLPMGLQYSVTAIGCAVLQAFVNSLGTTYVTAFSAGSKLSQFFCCPFDAMGSAMATYCGQNVGARRLERLSAGVKACSLLGLIYALVSLVFLAVFSPQLSLLFLKPDQTELIGLCSRYVVAQALFAFPLALVNILRFSIQGMGFSRLAVVAGVFEMVARTLMGALGVPLWGYAAACYAAPAAWLAADAFLLPACAGCIGSLRKKYGADFVGSAPRTAAAQSTGTR